MLSIYYTSSFKKDVKRCIKQGLKIQHLTKLISLLSEEKLLDASYKNHPLRGDYKGYMDCHVEPDWILIYRINKHLGILELVRTGSHSELFS